MTAHWTDAVHEYAGRRWSALSPLGRELVAARVQAGLLRLEGDLITPGPVYTAWSDRDGAARRASRWYAWVLMRAARRARRWGLLP